MRITAYKTTDGEIFELESDAITHQAQIDAAILESEVKSFIFGSIQNIDDYKPQSSNRILTDTIINMFYNDYALMQSIAQTVDSMINNDSSDSIS